MTIRTAKGLSALAGAGRHVMLMTDEPPPDNVSAWLPEGALQINSQEPQVAPRTVTTPTRVRKDAPTTLTKKLVKAVKDVTGAGSVQSWLALNGGNEVREALAADPRTHPTVLRLLASAFIDEAALHSRWEGEPRDGEHASLLSALVVNSAMPPQVLESLASECDSLELELLLTNPSISSDRIRSAANSNSESLREAAARNPATPADVLLQLSHDPSPEVRAAAAGNPSIPTGLLVEDRWLPWAGLSALSGGLICDSEPKVRDAVAANPRAPRWLLEALADKKDSAVRRAVSGNPNTPSDVIRRCCVGKLSSVAAANPSAPAVLLESLASQKTPEIRSAIAANPNTPAEVLRRLVALDEAETDLAISSNPKAPGDVLTPVVERAIQRSAWDQMVNLSLNPSTRDSDLAKIMRGGGRR